MNEAGEVGRHTRRVLMGRAGAAAGIAGLLAACGTAGAPQSAPASLQDQKGNVVFYARSNAVENQGQTQVYLPTFKEAAPNVTVEHVISAPSEDYKEKLFALWSSGDPPDVWGFGGNYYTYWARGMTADLTPLISRDKFDLNQFLPGLPDKFKVNGKQYGLPQLTTFGTLLSYNKKLFEEAGLKYPPADWEDKAWTVDRMLEYAQKLTKNAGEASAVYGITFEPYWPHDATWWWGGDAFLPEHYKNSIAPETRLDSPESIAVHQFAQDLRWKQHYSRRSGDASVAAPGSDDFKSGREGMHIVGGWKFWDYSVVKDFGWGAAALPLKASNKNPNYNDFWELSSQSKNRDAAWAFMKHLTSAEVQSKYSDLTGTPPTNKNAIDTFYKKYEQIMPRADLEKVTQGAIDPKRSVESPDHTFIDFKTITDVYRKEVRDPILNNQGAASQIIAKGKPAVDAQVKQIYDQWNGKLPK